MKLRRKISWLLISLLMVGSICSAGNGKAKPNLKGHFLAVGNNDAIWSSVQGSLDSWTDVRSGNDSFSFTGIAYGNKRFIATTLNGVALYSPDGAKSNWHPTNLKMMTSPNLNTKQLTCVAYGQGRFIAAGFTAGKRADYAMFFQLKDGHSSWSSKFVSGPFAVKAVASGKQNFVAVGENHASGCAQLFEIGPDLKKIKTFRLDGVQPLNAVTYGKNVFLAVGQNGQVYRWGSGRRRPVKYSLDGVANLLGVTYGKNRFVAVGFGGNVFYSKTGVSKEAWQKGIIPNVFCLYGITYGAGRFVAVGMDSDYKGAAWWSTDLVNWQKSLQNSPMLSAVVYKP